MKPTLLLLLFFSLGCDPEPATLVSEVTDDPAEREGEQSDGRAEPEDRSPGEREIHWPEDSVEYETDEKMLSRYRAMLRCYESALGRDSSLRGELTVAFNIEPTGSVSGVQFSMAAEPRLVMCTGRVVERFEFRPRPERVAMNIRVEYGVESTEPSADRPRGRLRYLVLARGTDFVPRVAHWVDTIAFH